MLLYCSYSEKYLVTGATGLEGPGASDLSLYFSLTKR